MIAEKFLDAAAVFERFRPAFFGCRKSAGDAGVFEALLRSCALQEAVNVARVEAVAGSDRIHRSHWGPLASPFTGTCSRDSALRAKFHNYRAANLRELFDRLLQTFGCSDFFCFALVWKQNINKWQHALQVGAPFIFRVVVRV